jgi:hypothetical protein
MKNVVEVAYCGGVRIVMIVATPNATATASAAIHQFLRATRM